MLVGFCFSDEFCFGVGSGDLVVAGVGLVVGLWFSGGFVVQWWLVFQWW